MARFSVVHVFGYNSAENEPILDEIWSTLSISGCLVSIFTVKLIQCLFPGLGTYFPHFRQCPMSDIG